MSRSGGRAAKVSGPWLRAWQEGKVEFPHLLVYVNKPPQRSFSACKRSHCQRFSIQKHLLSKIPLLGSPILGKRSWNDSKGETALLGPPKKPSHWLIQPSFSAKESDGYWNGTGSDDEVGAVIQKLRRSPLPPEIQRQGNRHPGACVRACPVEVCNLKMAGIAAVVEGEAVCRGEVGK